MRAILAIIAGVVLVGGAAAGTWYVQQQKIDELEEKVANLEADANLNPNDTDEPNETEENNRYTSEKGITVEVDSPLANSKVSSPLPVTGRVPGSWSFEASFPVEIVDTRGETIAEGPAQLLGDWMTEDLVPFSASIPYEFTGNGEGMLILHRSNPSDLAENEDRVEIPITF